MHKHTPVNVNVQHAQEQTGFNQRIAIALTKGVGTMLCAYLFALLAIVGIPGFHASITQWVQWTSQTFIQLTMLSVIMVGQSVLGRKQELQAEQQYLTTVKTYADTEALMHRLEAIETLLKGGDHNDVH